MSRGTGPGKPDGSSGSRRPAGALEAEVLTVVWSHGEAMSVSEVQQALSADLAYRTVLTVLTRLHAKGLLERVPVGRSHAYSPRRDPAELAAERMDAALRAGPQRSEVLQHFVGRLEPDEQAVLRDLLERGD
ncbi:BlaI/MecI/CopY family transcriptional regulator [Streptacidiphilus sp. PB12-B1b]|nr:BlaI/MecI/CopY family transcriptional regulator [Streptacidiphilus sp. PB12-B1b]